MKKPPYFRFEFIALLLGIFVASATQGQDQNFVSKLAGYTSSTANRYAEFNGLHWTVYEGNNPTDSEEIYILEVVIDPVGDKLLAEAGKGTISFDNHVWTAFDRTYCEVPSNNKLSIAFEPGGNIWLASHKEVAWYDGTRWTVLEKADASFSKCHPLTVRLSENELVEVSSKSDGIKTVTQGELTRSYVSSSNNEPAAYSYSMVLIPDGGVWVSLCSGFAGSHDEAIAIGPIGTLYSVGGFAINKTTTEWKGLLYQTTPKYGLTWPEFSAKLGRVHGQDVQVIQLDNKGDFWIGVPPEIQSEPEAATADVSYAIESSEATLFSDLSIFPNPSNGEFQVAFLTAVEGSTEVQVVSMLGQVEYTSHVKTVQGINTYRLNVSDVPAGMYVVTVDSGGATLHQTISIAPR